MERQLEYGRKKKADAVDDVNASWLPGSSVAQLWVAFEQEKRHPVLPLR